MERKSGNLQGVGKSYAKDSTNAESGMSRLSERGQERLRLVGEKSVRPDIANIYINRGLPKQTPDAATEAKPHRRRRRRVTARFYRLVIGAFVLFLIVSYGIAFWRLAQVEQKIHSVRNQVAAAEKRNNQLRNDLKKSTSDAYIEQTAREELGLVKPGETAWIVVTPEDPKSPFRVEKRATQGAVPGAEGW